METAKKKTETSKKRPASIEASQVLNITHDESLFDDHGRLKQMVIIPNFRGR